jgi:hypothetical protein
VLGYVAAGAPEPPGVGRMRESDVVTDVLRSRRTDADADGPAEGGPSPVAAVLTAALGPALTGLAVLTAVVLVAWVTDTRGTASAGAAVRLAADAWLLAQGGVLSIAGGSVDAVPLGLTVLPALLLYRAGGALAAGPAGRDLRSAARSVGAVAALYGVVAAVVAHAAGTAVARIGPLSAGAGAAVLALAAAGIGLVRSAGLGGAVAGVLPRAVPPVARAAGLAVAGLLAAGAVMAAVSLAAHGGGAADLTRVLDPGLVGGVLLLLVGLLLVPNGAVWATAYAAGPGFAMGAGTGVSPFGVTLGPVPALPMLAALPQSDVPPQALRVLLVVPLLAGLLAGLSVARGVPAAEPARARRCAGYGAAAGLLAGVLLALLAVLAGGAVGGGYLTAVGPSPWRMGLAVAVEVGVPAALLAAVTPAPRTDPSRVSSSADE